MRRYARIFGVLWLVACGREAVFECTRDDQCEHDGSLGACEASGFCSFSDLSCPSGKRYGEYASDELAGACVEVEAPLVCDPGCGACEVCEAGACVQAGVGTACEVECSDHAFGLADMDGGPICLAYAAGAGTGTCDAGGSCTLAGGCTEPGAEIAACDLACARDDHNCSAGTPVSAIDAASLCVTMAETADCHSTCTDDNGKPSTFVPRSCDAMGACVADPATDCGAYICDGDDCGTSCTKSTECAPMMMCDMMTGTCQ